MHTVRVRGRQPSRQAVTSPHNYLSAFRFNRPIAHAARRLRPLSARGRGRSPSARQAFGMYFNMLPILAKPRVLLTPASLKPNARSGVSNGSRGCFVCDATPSHTVLHHTSDPPKPSRSCSRVVNETGVRIWRVIKRDARCGSWGKTGVPHAMPSVGHPSRCESRAA
jgi:hypothetical protein